MPGTAYKVRVGAEGDSGFVSSEDVFETGPGEAHTTPVLVCAQKYKPLGTQLESGVGGACRAMDVWLWGPVGLEVCILVTFGCLNYMSYKIG